MRFLGAENTERVVVGASANVMLLVVVVTLAKASGMGRGQGGLTQNQPRRVRGSQGTIGKWVSRIEGRLDWVVTLCFPGPAGRGKFFGREIGDTNSEIGRTVNEDSRRVLVEGFVFAPEHLS